MEQANHDFESGAELARALAGAVALDLRAAIATRGAALLAVSGGSTPVHFFRALSLATIDWDRVVVTLVDERWVGADDERSNARIVRTNLLQGPAAATRFVPLFEPGVARPEDAISTVSTRIALLDLPFDAVVLGMGDDGHTASFFPGGDHLGEAIDPHTAKLVLPMNAQGAGEPRITLTLPQIIASRRLYLHIEGAAKRRVYREAADAAPGDNRLPISAVLHNAPANVYWCP